MSGRNTCSIPKVSSFCQGCNGNREECKKSNGNGAPEKEQKKSTTASNSVDSQPSGKNIFKKTEDRKMPFEQCPRNCLPPKAKPEQYCHQCGIFMAKKRINHPTQPTTATQTPNKKKKNGSVIKTVFAF